MKTKYNIDDDPNTPYFSDYYFWPTIAIDVVIFIVWCILNFFFPLGK